MSPKSISISNGIIKAASLYYIDIYKVGNYIKLSIDVSDIIDKEKINDIQSIKQIFLLESGKLIPV